MEAVLEKLFFRWMERRLSFQAVSRFNGPQAKRVLYENRVPNVRQRRDRHRALRKLLYRARGESALVEGIRRDGRSGGRIEKIQ